MADIEVLEIEAVLDGLEQRNWEHFKGLEFESGAVKGIVVNASAEGFDIRDAQSGTVKRVSRGVARRGFLVGDDKSIDQIRLVTGKERPSQRGVRLLNTDIEEERLYEKLRHLCGPDYHTTSRIRDDAIFKDISKVALCVENDPVKIRELYLVARNHSLRWLARNLYDTARAITHPEESELYEWTFRRLPP